jgi:hypothetical protein
MAAAELTTTARPVRGLASVWASVYLAVWGATLLTAAVVVCAGPAARQEVMSLLGLRLQAAADPAPSAKRVAALAVHNIPIACWPVLLGVFAVGRKAWGRVFFDLLVACWLVANTAPVGAAFASYGTPLVGFVPQLPIEWAGLALGASGWVLQRRSPMTFRRGAGLAAACAGVMVVAAFVETVVPPHA